MRPIRKRIILVLILILSQVTALTVLAGALWFVKVKETMPGRITFSRSNGQMVADIILSKQDAVKVQEGNTIYGEISSGGFVVRVMKQQKTPNGSRLQAVVLQQSADGRNAENAEPVDALMWTRKRRALTILLDRSTLAKSRTRNLTNTLSL